MNNGDMPVSPLMGCSLYDFPDAPGLTKREYFAGLAVQGLLAGGYCIDDARNRIIDVPSEALKLADSLLIDLGE